jgi:hypothetical protein
MVVGKALVHTTYYNTLGLYASDWHGFEKPVWVTGMGT